MVALALLGRTPSPRRAHHPCVRLGGLALAADEPVESFPFDLTPQAEEFPEGHLANERTTGGRRQRGHHAVACRIARAVEKT